MRRAVLHVRLVLTAKVLVSKTLISFQLSTCCGWPSMTNYYSSPSLKMMPNDPVNTFYAGAKIYLMTFPWFRRLQNCTPIILCSTVIELCLSCFVLCVQALVPVIIVPREPIPIRQVIPRSGTATETPLKM